MWPGYEVLFWFCSPCLDSHHVKHIRFACLVLFLGLLLLSSFVVLPASLSLLYFFIVGLKKKNTVKTKIMVSILFVNDSWPWDCKSWPWDCNWKFHAGGENTYRLGIYVAYVEESYRRRFNLMCTFFPEHEKKKCCMHFVFHAFIVHIRLCGS